MENFAKKMTYTGKFVQGEIDKDALKYWEDIGSNFTEIKIKLIELIESWRNENSISINEFCKRIDITPRQYYRIINKETNITILSLVEITKFLGYKLEINFKKLE
ncbi:helix-turn-helix domain-containing protein [Spirobacillus cienkowskii]|jgi:DNA integrity scanning protein DisA with diadenylate cyclase activity|uniref:XRE family transcriptional regulator n=1 Tax=Spirobacillus cienkowskii TaxID=495820 RepID=A0A369KSW9_9BACT|nr:MAG: XRE family transcriptional regulator [Spirobacillus cienkowskii]